MRHAALYRILSGSLWIALAASGAVGSEGPEAGPASRVPEAVRDAPWKVPRPGAGAPQPSLEASSYRIGSWISEAWSGEGAGRHRIRIVDARDLNDHVVRSTSYRVYADGREERYLTETYFLHAGRKALVGHLHFDDGLYADATLVADAANVRRLDCDLVWPNGKTGRVRDVFVTEGDRIYWTMYVYRGETLDPQPRFETTLVRQD